jgi:hypothetical protein
MNRRRLKPKVLWSRKALGRMDGRRDGQREIVRGEYRFSSLMKQKKRGGKLHCLLLRRKKKIIIFIFMM